MSDFDDDCEDEELLPAPEDFIPVIDRAECPICGQEMIHTRIEVDEDLIFHCWLCDCEIQPGHVEEMVRDGRQGAPGQSLLIRGEFLWEDEEDDDELSDL